MSAGWPRVPLGELLRPVGRAESVDPSVRYRILGAHWYAKGLYIKETKAGSEIRAPRLYRVEEGDFVYNRLFGWKGSFAVATPDNHGCYVSNEFPCFAVDRTRLDPYFLWGYFSRPSVWDEALGLSAGGTPTSRNRLMEEKLYEIRIPLPALLEQRRIVARIEDLAARIDDVRALRRDTQAVAEALCRSASDTAFKPRPGWIEAHVAELCDPPQYGFTASATVEPVGPRLLRITDIQEGRVNWGAVPFCQCPNPEPYRLQGGDLLFARTGATTGKSFLIRESPEAVFASYLIRLRVRRLVTADYLYAYFQTPSYWSQITGEKKGTGQPNVNGGKLASIRVPVPSLDEQRGIVEFLASLEVRLRPLRQLQAETAAELDALLPSILDKAFKGELP